LLQRIDQLMNNLASRRRQRMTGAVQRRGLRPATALDEKAGAGDNA